MYDVGDTVKLVAPDVLDASGAPADSTTQTLTITRPSQTTASGTVTRLDAGRYCGTYVAGEYGRHVARFVFAGVVPDQAHVDVFNVTDPAWPAILGTAEVRRHLGYDEDDTSRDDEIRASILCVSAVIEDITGDVVQRTHTELHNGGERVILLRHRPVLEVVQVVADGTVVSPSNYTCSSAGVLYAKFGTWNRGIQNVQVQYRAGRVATSPATLDAGLELIRINWRPKLGGNYSPFDGEGDDDNGASRTAESNLQGELRLGWFIPNAVMQRLQPTARGPHIA